MDIELSSNCNRIDIEQKPIYLHSHEKKKRVYDHMNVCWTLMKSKLEAWIIFCVCVCCSTKFMWKRPFWTSIDLVVLFLVFQTPVASKKNIQHFDRMSELPLIKLMSRWFSIILTTEKLIDPNIYMNTKRFSTHTHTQRVHKCKPFYWKLIGERWNWRWFFWFLFLNKLSKEWTRFEICMQIDDSRWKGTRIQNT